MATHPDVTSVPIPSPRRTRHVSPPSQKTRADLESQVEELEGLRRRLEEELRQRQSAQQRLAIQYVTARTLAEATSVAALKSILQAVCEEAGWEIGAIWLREAATNRLACVELWHQPQTRLREFIAMTRELRFERGTGLPGEVWTRGEPVWHAELTEQLKLPRLMVATREGLRAAFAVPIRIDQQVVGAIEFFGRESRPPDEDFLQMADAVGSQVGQFIERKATEGSLLHARNEQQKAGDAHRWLAAIVESSDDAIIGKNLSSVITSWNAGAERVFGYKAEEIIGKTIYTLIPPELHFEEPGIIARIGRGERIDHYETSRRHKDGHLLEVSLTVSPIKDDSGRIIGASKIARDITKQKEAERALRAARDELAQLNAELERRVEARTASLRQAIEQMEEFSYSVSHDLRSPARAMAGYAVAVLEDYGERLGPEGREFLDRIVRNATRMDRLIQDLLTYSRLSRRDISVQPVALDKLVRETIEQYPEMHAPRAEIVVEGKLHTVLAHEPSLSQAVSSLLSNAVKFVPPNTKPVVRVRSEPAHGQIRLWVEDNGIGIPPQYRDRLFGMFERVHPEKKYEGTGIGLAIVRKAAERMGGSAGVESNAGAGSRFWIQIPAAPVSA